MILLFLLYDYDSRCYYDRFYNEDNEEQNTCKLCYFFSQVGGLPVQSLLCFVIDKSCSNLFSERLLSVIIY